MVEKVKEAQFIKICKAIKLDVLREDRVGEQREERRLKRNKI